MYVEGNPTDVLYGHRRSSAILDHFIKRGRVFAHTQCSSAEPSIPTMLGTWSILTIALAAYGLVQKELLFTLWFVVYFGSSNDPGVVPCTYLIGSLCFFCIAMCTDRFNIVPFTGGLDMCHYTKPPLNFVGSLCYLTGSVNAFVQYMSSARADSGKAEAVAETKAKSS